MYEQAVEHQVLQQGGGTGLRAGEKTGLEATGDIALLQAKRYVH